MRITSRRLRSLIQSAILESESKNLGKEDPGDHIPVSVGDVIRVELVVEPSASDDWGGCYGYVISASIDPFTKRVEVCDVSDPDGILPNLISQPCYTNYITFLKKNSKERRRRKNRDISNIKNF
jgi:hypothetical protein